MFRTRIADFLRLSLKMSAFFVNSVLSQIVLQPKQPAYATARFLFFLQLQSCSWTYMLAETGDRS